MSYYIVVEGARTEVKVYPEWIRILNPGLAQVHDLADLEPGKYYLVSGYGYPNYRRVIKNALADMEAHSHIQWLVIAVDAEDMSYEEKRREISDCVGNSSAAPKTQIIVQNACLETWALGNKLIVKRNPQDAKLRHYIRIHNVVREDPENLPELPAEHLNRAQFAGVYLRRALHDR